MKEMMALVKSENKPSTNNNGMSKGERKKIRAENAKYTTTH
jgi:hypothetical protein